MGLMPSFIKYVDVDTQPASARAQNFTQLATLWAGARQGVSDAVAAGVPKPQVMIHIDVCMLGLFGRTCRALVAFLC